MNEVDGIRHLLLLAFGDNVISLYFLNQIDREKNVIGTGLTEEVMAICDFDHRIRVKRAFAQIPAFYNIKHRGVMQAFRDFAALIRFLSRNRIRAVSFEKRDFRSALLTNLLFLRGPAPRKRENIYFDRKANLERIYSVSLDMHELENGYGGKRILINPASRREEKNIRPDDLKCLIEILKRHRKEISLIDYDGVYGAFQSEVRNYHTRTALATAANLLRETDFYIGADSLFVHLAYVFRRPFFIFLNQRNDYFMPPHCAAKGNYIVRDEISGKLEQGLEERFWKLKLL